MTEVLFQQRKSVVLKPSKLPCMAGLPTLNLASGCADGCVYCYAQGFGNYPGNDKVVLYSNVLQRLKDEVCRRRQKPAAVCFSSASDLFQDIPESLDLTLAVLDFLLKAGIGVVFLTKGRIPRAHMELLREHAPRVQAQIGLITIDRAQTRILEPGAATPHVRLEQMRELIDAGIATQARVDPIMPGLTDDPATLRTLCEALAKAGITEISASTLFVRYNLTAKLRRRMDRPVLFSRLMEAFRGGKWLRIPPEQGSILTLPLSRRRRIFSWLSQIAQQYGIAVHVCACKNPDLATGSCTPGNPWAAVVAGKRQLSLFA